MDEVDLEELSAPDAEGGAQWSRSQRRLLVAAALVVAASFAFSAGQDKRRTDVGVRQDCRAAAYEIQNATFGRDIDREALQREVSRRLARCGSRPLPLIPDRQDIPNDPER